MSKREKVIKRLLSMPGDFTYAELKQVLSAYDFQEITGGKTAGSAVKFMNEKTGEKIYLHKPHQGDIVKKYVLQEVIRMIRRKHR